MSLSVDQEAAWNKILRWVDRSDNYFVLRGFAGTGKSYLMNFLAQSDIDNLYFTATTNKATKVLSNIINRETSTIYSLLGLSLKDVEDKQIIVLPKRPVQLPERSIVIVDEASMVSKQLKEIIDETVMRSGIRIIYVGDPAQLPPIGEKYSLVWDVTEDSECRHGLKTVMRNDSQLLNLATSIRDCIKTKNWNSPIKEDISETGEGIYVLKSEREFKENLLEKIKSADNIQDIKFIAWRNDIVNEYNDLIREALGFKDTYNVGEVILIAKPIRVGTTTVAYNDDDYTINEICDSSVYVDIENTVETWKLNVSNPFNSLVLQIPKNVYEVENIVKEKFDIARKAPKKFQVAAWKEGYRARDLFQSIRYGYALTAHRAQGSTLKECYIDQCDILRNWNKKEAYRCLYVACTRPTKAIYTF